jgi:DNA-binding MurR/RpiR family transcriptional regulator
LEGLCVRGTTGYRVPCVRRRRWAPVAEQIHRELGRLTPSERKPARLLLGHYPVVGLEPLASFAQRAGVSHPSILRFIAKLG